MITEELVKKSLDLMASSPANYEYFFIRLKTADWIEPLWKAGRFKSPPAARRQEDTISFPSWPESRYLVRVAGEAPEAVKKVILEVPQTDKKLPSEKQPGSGSRTVCIYCTLTKSLNSSPISLLRARLRPLLNLPEPS